MAAVRARIEFEGIVQGVGFRPFLHQLAEQLHLPGWVLNTSAGVLLELEGPREKIELFISTVVDKGPPLSRVLVTRTRWLPVVGFTGFSIKPSQALADELTLICPDVALCKDCAEELGNPTDRRYRYPFTNCTNCGPRYTIISNLPYDRPNTTMRQFELCPDCNREYMDVSDRRYHAQPVACPACGPRIWLETDEGEQLHGDEIRLAGKLLRNGAIVGVKGLGGFHLACRADLDEAVLKLRKRKGRSFFKPLAVMVGNIGLAQDLCQIDEPAETWLKSAQSPVVLVPLRPGVEGRLLSRYVAPRLNRVGLMLPYTPLHRLLLAETGVPLVMTSGNLSDEPICADNDEARHGLVDLCDVLLMHDRPIQARCDDSVLASTGQGSCVMFRHSRGFSPFPIALPDERPVVLALGGDIKTTFAASQGHFAFLSPHLGDGEQAGTYTFLRDCWEHYRSLFSIKPAAVACDAHPGYHTGRWAKEIATELGIPVIKTFHHHAHLVSLQTEHHLTGRDVAIVADGTGFGEDGTLWGGEVLYGDAASCERLAHLHPIMLPGGDSATREPWRIAVSLIHAAAPERLASWLDDMLSGRLSKTAHKAIPGRLDAGEDPAYLQPASADAEGVQLLLARRLNTVPTTALGRLLDGLAALLGICLISTYEGQAPMELEALLGDPSEPTELAAQPNLEHSHIIDWRPLVRLLLTTQPEPRAASQLIHQWIATEFFVKALPITENTGRLLATGGCLQNMALVQILSRHCNEKGIELVTHNAVPPGDGGLALGSLRIAQSRL